MICDIESVRPDAPIFRLGRSPNPWAWPDWAYAGDDGTFGNRFDDPASEYRVLYASSQRLGPFLETLARFRPDPTIVAEPIAGDPRDAEYETRTAGVIPAGWLEARALGSARCEADFAHVGHARSLAYLRDVLASAVLHHGLADLDAASIRASAPRRFTQELSRFVYECSRSEGGRAFQGIHYLSRLGDDIGNWAIYEPAALEPINTQGLRLDDPDLQTALRLFSLAVT